MDFDYEELPLKVDGDDKLCQTWDHKVSGNPVGNLVIVVIDDEYQTARRSPALLGNNLQMVFPLLRVAASKLPEIRAIGFFPLAKDKNGANVVLECIQNWIDTVKEDHTQVYFLLDQYSSDGTDIASRHTVDCLTKTKKHPQQCIAALTTAGFSGDFLSADRNFVKANVARYIRDSPEAEFSPKLREFFGIEDKLHRDSIISETIQFYAKPWKEKWDPNFWCHNQLNQKSKHLEELSEWLNVSIDDLVYNKSTNTDSAKSLMIWKDKELWEDPPWMARDRRSIQGNVFNAVLKKFEIIGDNLFQDDESIIMPCVPCFPFLVTLKSFLWCCKEEGTPVRKIQFFKLGESPQANILRLILPLKDSAKDFVASFRGLARQGVTVKSLTNLTYCKTDKLEDNETYMQLFKGTDFPVVSVEIAPYWESRDNRGLGQIIPCQAHSPQELSDDNRELGQINLIWSVK